MDTRTVDSPSLIMRQPPQGQGWPPSSNGSACTAGAATAARDDEQAGRQVDAAAVAPGRAGRTALPTNRHAYRDDLDRHRRRRPRQRLHGHGTRYTFPRASQSPPLSSAFLREDRWSLATTRGAALSFFRAPFSFTWSIPIGTENGRTEWQRGAPRSADHPSGARLAQAWHP